jgi:hypothetical protein
MFLGFVALGATLARHLQLADGNAPATADAQPTFRIYGTDGTPVATGTCSAVVDSQTGLHKLEQQCTADAGFARGTYTIRLAYAVSTVAKVQSYTFTIV